MAIVDTFSKNKDKDEQSQQLGGQAITSTSALGGDAAGATTSGEQKGSGLFTNIQDYINANKGAGQKLASGIERTGQGDVQKVQQNIAGTQKLEQDIGAEQNRVNQAGQLAQQIATNPIDAAKNKLADIEKLRTGQSQYNTLQSGYQDAMRGLQQGSQKLQQLDNQVGTEQGRFDLLRRTYGRPNYSQGAQRLDQLFLQTEGDRTLDNLQQNVRNIAQQGMQAVQERGQLLGSQLDTLNTGIGEAQQTIQGALGSFGTEGGGALGDLYRQLESERASAEQRQQSLFDRVQEQLPTGQLDADVAQALGINEDINTFDLDLGQYLQGIGIGDNNITMADVASQEQQARLDALRQLSGIGTAETNLGVQGGDVGLTGFNLDAIKSAADARREQLLNEYFKLKRDERIIYTSPDRNFPRRMEILRTLGKDRQALERIYNASHIAQMFMTLDEYMAGRNESGGIRIKPADFTDIGSVE